MLHQHKGTPGRVSPCVVEWGTRFEPPVRARHEAPKPCRGDPFRGIGKIHLRFQAVPARKCNGLRRSSRAQRKESTSRCGRVLMTPRNGTSAKSTYEAPERSEGNPPLQYFSLSLLHHHKGHPIGCPLWCGMGYSFRTTGSRPDRGFYCKRRPARAEGEVVEAEVDRSS